MLPHDNAGEENFPLKQFNNIKNEPQMCRKTPLEGYVGEELTRIHLVLNKNAPFNTLSHSWSEDS